MVDIVFILCVCVIDILFIGWVYYTCDNTPDYNISDENINNPLTPQH